MTKTALIAGASGMVGNHVLGMLLRDPSYDKVVSIGRRKLEMSDPKLKQVIIDFEELDEHAELFGADHIYCCLGTTIKKAKTQDAFRKVDQIYPLKMASLAESNNAMCYSIITAIGSDATSNFFYNRVKGEVESELETKNIPCVYILQPSMLLGERDDHRLGERIGQVAMKFTNGIMIGGLKKYKAIDGLQVARAMIAITKEERKGFYRYPNDQLLEF